MGGNSFNAEEGEHKIVSFKDWNEALAKAGFFEAPRLDMQQAVFGFLRFFKGKGAAGLRHAHAVVDR